MSKEKRLLQRIEKERAQNEKIQQNHEKLKNAFSRINVNSNVKKVNDDPEEEKDIFSAASTGADKLYEKSFGNIFDIFKPEHYEDKEIPEDRIKSVMEHPDGTIEPIDIEPEMIKPWVCDYHYTPEYRVRLVTTIFALIGALLVLSLSMSYVITYGSFMALGLIILLLINVSFRYTGLAVWKYPMPKIPYLSNLRIERHEEEDEPETYEEELGSSSNVNLVDPVEKYNDYGDPSPATVLTQWMNGSARMTESDLIGASGGVLDTFRVKLLLNDNQDIWTDSSTIDTLSRITNSRPSQWRDTWYNWDR